jgi:hypothetical protein
MTVLIAVRLFLSGAIVEQALPASVPCITRRFKQLEFENGTAVPMRAARPEWSFWATRMVILLVEIFFECARGKRNHRRPTRDSSRNGG